jgi:hypothetical protein
MDNLTREHGLVTEITNRSWFANPAGKQGYEVILLERVGDGGTRYYCSLKPGETLRLAERLLNSYTALEVDIRHARAFPVKSSFNTKDRGKKISLELNVRYYVTDAKIVAMETVDPLGELYSKVITTLNRDLQNSYERDVSATTIERSVRNIGEVPHLGLAVEDVEIISFTSDSRATQHVVEEEDVRHSIEVDTLKRQASLQARTEEEEATLAIKSKRYEAIDLSKLNVLLQEYPDVIPQVIASFSAREQKLLDAKIDVVQQSIHDYMDQQKQINAVIDPRQIGNILRDALSSSQPQLPSSSDIPSINWGDDVIAGETQETKDSDSKIEKEKKSKPSKKGPHIKFGDSGQ